PASSGGSRYPAGLGRFALRSRSGSDRGTSLAAPGGLGASLASPPFLLSAAVAARALLSRSHEYTLHSRRSPSTLPARRAASALLFPADHRRFSARLRLTADAPPSKNRALGSRANSSAEERRPYKAVAAGSNPASPTENRTILER